MNLHLCLGQIERDRKRRPPVISQSLTQRTSHVPKGLRTYRSIACIQLIHEALIPSVDAVPQDLLHDIEQAFLTEPIALGERQLQLFNQRLRLLRVDQDIARDAFNIDGCVAVGLLASRLIGCSDVRDDQTLDGIKQLLNKGCRLVRDIRENPRLLTMLRYIHPLLPRLF